ncbi:hypothetical protein MMC07_009047 [Pseudocyphellaria aurata]|nr:hypothetical protein [Pseudocyphellaria aurata]
MSSLDEEDILDCPPAAESQSLEDINVIKMAHKIAESTKRRREAKRTRAQHEHAESVKRLQTKIITSFDCTSKRISNTHRAQFRNLADLLRRKTSLETSMMACAKRLEKAIVATSQELQFTLEGRVKDVEELAAIALRDKQLGLHTNSDAATMAL